MAHNKGILLKRKKLILNKHNNKNLEIAIAEIRKDHNNTYFVVSFGAGKEATIIGIDEWYNFLELLLNLDRQSDDTWIRPLPKLRAHNCRFD